jgi:hypothetical protein
VPQQVDHRLIGSSLARVHWELDILRRWQRDPGFYIEQTLTPVGEALTLPTPYDEKQSREIMSRLNNIPEILGQAQQNLVSPPSPFAKMAIDSLIGIRPKLEQMAKTLAPQTTIAEGEWQASAERAATSLEAYRAWLQKALPKLPAQSATGRENYTWFLQNVALIPYTPEELVARAEQEFRRAVAFEKLEANRNRSVPPLVMAPTLKEFITRNRTSEAEVREFLKHREVLTLPAWLQHYTLRPIPPYLAALGELPGQKISYQTGKLQIMQMLQDAQLNQRDNFSVESFHNYVWLNGNVPIALLRWEYLGLDDDVNK